MATKKIEMGKNRRREKNRARLCIVYIFIYLYLWISGLKLPESPLFSVYKRVYIGR